LKGLSFSIDSHLGNVSLVAVAVNRICVQLGLDDLSAGQVELCVAEAATNAIRHAYHGEPGHTVMIALAASTDQLNIEVSDRGTPMPVEQEQRLLHGTQANEFQTTDLRSLPEGGRGLQIIHDLMDEVSYVRLGNINRLTMRKQFVIPGMERAQGK
jgi:serine/threonine-protein kinase RsbW